MDNYYAMYKTVFCAYPYQIFKEVLMPVLQAIQLIENEGRFLNSFHRATVTLTPIDPIKKRNYKLMCGAVGVGERGERTRILQEFWCSGRADAFHVALGGCLTMGSHRIPARWVVDQGQS